MAVFEPGTFALCLQAVKLESAHAGRTRYLVVVSREGRTHHEESCLLGIDCSGGSGQGGGQGGQASDKASTVGLVLRVLADTAITLDGDGSVISSCCTNFLLYSYQFFNVSPFFLLSLICCFLSNCSF